MPDIAMCKNAVCNKSMDCWRYRATPYKRGQSYADFKNPKKEKCFMAMPKVVVK